VNTPRRCQLSTRTLRRRSMFVCGAHESVLSVRRDMLSTQCISPASTALWSVLRRLCSLPSGSRLLFWSITERDATGVRVCSTADSFHRAVRRQTSEHSRGPCVACVSAAAAPRRQLSRVDARDPRGSFASPETLTQRAHDSRRPQKKRPVTLNGGVARVGR